MDSHEWLLSDETSRPSDIGQRSNHAGPPTEVLNSLAQELVNRLARKLPTGETDNPGLPVGPSDAQIDEFCDILISGDPARSHQYFQVLRRAGTTPDTLSLRYIAPAARRLGERWVADDCSFLEVTLGSARLHALQRSLRDAFKSPTLYAAPALSALFCGVPGDGHVLGISIAADFFRRAGWDVDLDLAQDRDRICARAAERRYGLIGLSAGAQCSTDELAQLVDWFRTNCPWSMLVLGGQLTVLEPDIAERLDILAADDDISTAPFALQRDVLARNAY